MTFSVNLLLDILSGESVKLYDEAGQTFAFERLALLTRETRQLEPGTLYIGSLERIEALGSYASGALIVCAGEETAVSALARKWGLSLLALPTGTDLLEIANRLNDSFLYFNAWENELKGAMLSGKSLQTIAEIGGEIFGDSPVVFGSSSYNIVGRSMTETPYNEKVSEILSRGYFLKEEADALSRMGYPANRDNYRDAVLINPPTYMGCSFFLVSFAASLKRLSYIAVYFVKEQPTEGLMDLFRIFSDHVRSYCESMQNDDRPMTSALEMFMEDLLMHTQDDEMYLRDRARQLQLPADEPYRLGLIQWEEYSRDQAEYVLWRVRYGFSFPFFRVMRYHDTLLLILKGHVTKAVLSQRINEALREFSDILSICGGHIGFSTEVDSLFKLDVAYKQACAALQFGRILAPGDDLYFYSNYYIYDMIDAYGAKFRPEDMFVQKLRLLDSSEEGRYNNLHLLRYYLLSERSLSVTARYLHLHRNSVIYRLGKIENILGVDLDDPEVRLRLLISFKILEYLDGRRLPGIELDEKEEHPIPVSGE